MLLMTLAACGSVAVPGTDGGDRPDAASTAPDAAPGAPDAAPPCGTLYVTNFGGGGVEIFDCLATRDDTRVGGDRVLAGAATGLTFGEYAGIAVDPGRDLLYVSEHGDGTVRIWEHASTISGDVAPDRVLTTGAGYQQGLALDVTHDRLYVADDNFNPNQILVYAGAHAVSGAATPVAVISIADSFQLSIDEVHDRLYVAMGTAVAVYDGASTITGTGATAARTFAPATSTNFQGVAIDVAHDVAYVSERAAAGTIYAVPGASTASGTVAPTRTIVGTTASEHLTTAEQVQIVDDRLYTVNDSASRVWIYDPASAASGAVAPARAILLGLHAGQADGFLFVP